MKILLLGINGKMGSKIYQSLKDRGFTVEGFDLLSNKDVTTITDVNLVNPKNYDWLVDFSKENISIILTTLFLKNGVNVISGTTGIKDDKLEELRCLAKENNAKYIHRVNFSSCFCTYEKLVAMASSFLPNKIIIESHDLSKYDKPSGSALHLAKTIGLDNNDIISLRINEPEPCHQVIISNEKERIVLIHQVLDKKAFEDGFMEIFMKEVGV